MRSSLPVWAVLLFLPLVGLAGCATSGTGDAGSSPEAVFKVVRDAILRGDMETVFANYSTRMRTMESLEGLKAQFAANRGAWITKYANASVRQVSDDKQGRATMIVLYGDGTRLPAIPFVQEGKNWRIDG
ncbi:MAG: hypothetical protein HYZ53_06735 [Planctomycetes bacterium]|nr:hypothetical protein [Planctomycetota bacterium]